MNRKKYPLFENYDFSDCHEITGDELFLINGGARVENSNEAVANAKEGDTLVRNDGTEVTLTQGDINWAQKQVGSSSSSGTDTSTSQTTTTSASESSSPTESSNTTGSSSSNNSSSSLSSSGSSSSTSSGNSSSSSSQGTRPNNTVSLTNKDNMSGMNGYADSGSQRNTSVLNSRNLGSNVNIQNSNNEINVDLKRNKQKGRTIIEKIATVLSNFIAPDGINVDMNPENSKKNLFLQKPETKCLYTQETFDKPLIQVSIGKREALGIGYSYSAGIAINQNNYWDSGITVTVGGGIGIEKTTSLTTNNQVNQVMNIASSSVDFTKPVSTADIEGSSVNIYASAGAGITCDANQGKLKGFQIGSVGGGAYYEGTTAITIGEVAEYFCNTPSFIMNQIYSHSGMNKFVKFDYIELDGK